MARRKSEAYDRGIRDRLAAKWRAFAIDLADRLGLPVGAVATGYLERAASLERGEPVEVAAWELPRELRPPLHSAPNRFVVEPDGTVRPVEERS